MNHPTPETKPQGRPQWRARARVTLIKSSLFMPLLFLLPSCATNSGVEFVELQQIQNTPISNTGFDLELLVTLNSTFKGAIKVQNAEIEAFGDKQKVAIVRLLEPVVIRGRSVDTYSVRVRIRAPLGLVPTPEAFIANYKSLKITGHIHARKGLLRKRIKLNRTLSQTEMQDLLNKISRK